MSQAKPQPQNNQLQSAIQKQFGNVAERYAHSTVHAGGQDLEQMVALARQLLPVHAHVLDAGCGAGHTALAVAPYAKQVYACDLTRPMLQQTEQLAWSRRVANVSTQQVDLHHLPFKSASFDAVVSRYSAHHWADPQAALDGIARVLRPTGILLFSDIIAPESAHADSFLQTIETLRDPSHVRDHRIDEWQDMLAWSGFRESQLILRFELKMSFKAWLERMATPPVYASAIRALIQQAPSEIRHTFHFPAHMEDERFDFVLHGAVIQALR